MNNRISTILKKAYRKIYCTIFIKLHEKRDNGLTYCLKRYSKSENLIVVFSAFPEKGKPGCYNMIWTLRGINSNILWILDPGGFNSVGTYYLGKIHDRKSTLLNCVELLIRKIWKNVEAKRTYYIGSSKGGTAAIILGLKMNSDCVIVGSPQYYIGTYLSENNYHKAILQSICSEEYAVEYLDSLLPNLIENCKKSSTFVRIMYSNKENSYSVHLTPLISALEKCDIKVEKEIVSYENHNEIALFYPDWVKNILYKECN